MRNIFFFFLSAALVWLIPFCLRFAFKEQITFNNNQVVNPHQSYDKITETIKSKDLDATFNLILSNNIKVGLINITGGVIFGVPTILNLMYNGFSLADTIVIAQDAGVSGKFIFYSLLAPHIVELIGIWLTASLGLSSAYSLYTYIISEQMPDRKTIISSIYFGIAGLLIITVAAWLETFVTIKNFL